MFKHLPTPVVVFNCILCLLLPPIAPVIIIIMLVQNNDAAINKLKEKNK